MLHTSRLTLRPWRETDRDAFAALNADPDVARDLGGPLDRPESDAKFDRYVSAFRQHGFCRWAVLDLQQLYLGYAGVMPSPPGHPLGPHAEIGWRLARAAWGQGYATEAAAAALLDIFGRIGLGEVLAYTSDDNARSQAVMQRLGLRRDPARDFTHVYGGKPWLGRVWVARPVA
ncbi:MAG: GNAT family N-acetyltransferase [Enhydrobacter sp.]|nr:GNAT family N-acetyltransferase [Enhydrobacter sp.]